MGLHYLRKDVISGAVLVSISGYSLCGIGMILLNKVIMNLYDMNYPMAILLVQTVASLGIISTSKACGWCFYPDITWKVTKQWVPLTLLFLGMLYSSMRSLETMSVASQSTLKNIAMILTAFGDTILFNRRMTAGMLISFLFMLLGSYLNAIGDQWVTKVGLAWTFLNIAATVGYTLYMKVLLEDVKQEIGKYGPVFYNNLLSLPFMLLCGYPDVSAMASKLWAASFVVWLIFLLKILFAVGISFTTFYCMACTSPTTVSVIGAMNKIPLAGLGIVVFGHYPSVIGYSGIFLGLVGGLLYAWAAWHSNVRQGHKREKVCFSGVKKDDIV